MGPQRTVHATSNSTDNFDTFSSVLNINVAPSGKTSCPYTSSHWSIFPPYPSSLSYFPLPLPFSSFPISFPWGLSTIRVWGTQRCHRQFSNILSLKRMHLIQTWKKAEKLIIYALKKVEKLLLTLKTKKKSKHVRCSSLH